jgi:predicted permease
MVRRSHVDAELDAELDDYLEASASAKMAQGMSRVDALRAARTELGSVEAVKDRVRDAGWEASIENLWRDIRSGMRLLRRSPGFAAVAVWTLALGIGASTAIFSVINALLLRPVPVARADRLATISSDYALRHGFTAGVGWNYDMWQRLQERVSAFDGALAWTDARFNLASGGENDFVEGLFTDGAFFTTLGVRAILGRTFEPADDLLPRAQESGETVAVISYRMWQRRFKGAADVVGQPLVVDGVPFTIIGVTPAEFFGLEVGKAFDVALPLGSEPLIRGPGSLRKTNNFLLTVVLRLKPDQSIESGTAVIRALQPQILGVAPDELPRVVPPFLREPFTLIAAPTGTADRTGLRREYRLPLLIVFALVTLVVIVACLNVANLLLARASARKHEFALRLALGSPAWRLGRQLLVESLVLAALGAWLGLVVAGWIGKALVNQISLSGVPAYLDLSVDVRVLLFSMAAGLITAIIFGTAPAFLATRTPPIEALKDQSSRSTQAPAGAGRMPLPALFIVLQVAFSLVLIVASALLVRTFDRLARVPLGFERDRVLVVRVNAARAAVAPQQLLAFFQRLADVVRTVPGVAEAAASHMTPFGDGSRAPILAQRDRMQNAVGPDWFATYGTPFHAGRDVNSGDVVTSPPVAIINESYARNFFAGRSPLGETVEGRTIVGVVGNAVFGSLRRGMLPTMYLPLSQSASMRAPGNTSVSISVRPAAGAPLQLAPAVGAALTAVDPRLSFTFGTVGADVDASMARERLLAWLSSAFGLLTLFLAALGLYGISSYSAVRRRAEIGMRVALGASRSNIVSLVVSRSVLVTLIGMALGLIVAAWVTRYLEGLLFGLTPLDPASFIVVAVIFSLVAVVASAIPAWRASNVDPLAAIRGD